MNITRLNYLYERYQTEQLNAAEQLEWGQLLKDPANDVLLQELFESAWSRQDLPAVEPETTASESIYQYIIAQPQRQKTRRSAGLWLKLSAAAAIGLLAFGVYFFKAQQTASEKRERIARNIPPGGNKALLTLANGQIINLDEAANGQLVQQAGINVTKTRDGQLVYSVKETSRSPEKSAVMNTIATPRGGQYQVSLPDGSKVWLNTASSLKFPVQFSKKERLVILQGEAYFEIAKNKHLPFLVQTEQQEVQVLGTHFNVKSYSGEATTRTTLLEGSVAIAFKNRELKPALLKPGQQALLRNNDEVSIAEAETEQVLAWKNGLFMFNGQNLEGIMTEVARWYDVEVVFENEKLKKQAFKGVISRFKNIAQLLEVLESTGSVKFKVEGRRITAM
jgi:transmembrane sensor